MNVTDSPYAETTKSMQADPEVSHRGESASESFLLTFPISVARCAGTDDELDWVPRLEKTVVPPEMASMCAECPGRQQCLLWALAGDEAGYWGGTTAKDRQTMKSLAQTSVETADWIQDQAKMGSQGEEAKHRAGEGSLKMYRHGTCRCYECRAANSEARAYERARAKSRQAA